MRKKPVIINRGSTPEETAKVFGMGKKRLEKVRKMVDEVIPRSPFEVCRVVSDSRIPKGFTIRLFESRGYDSPDRWYEVHYGMVKIGRFSTVNEAITGCKKPPQKLLVLASDGQAVIRTLNRLLKERGIRVKQEGTYKQLGDQRYLSIEEIG